MIRIAGNVGAAIGLDFDSRAFRLAQMAPSRQGRCLAAAAVLPRLTDGTALGRDELEQLRRVLLRQQFRGRRVVLGVPEQTLVSSILELPPRTSGAPLETIARAELAAAHDYDPQAAECDCWDLPAGNRTKGACQVMAVACLHRDAEPLLEVCEDAGLEVVALDTRLHALVRACRPLLTAGAVTAVLDLGWDWAVLLLVCGGNVVYRRMAAEGSARQLARSLADGLGLEEDSVDYLMKEVGLAPTSSAEAAMPHEAVVGTIRKHLDALAESVQAPLTYATHQHGVPTVGGLLLTGPGAAVPGAADYLHGRLEVPVQSVGPRQVAACGPALNGLSGDPSLMGALGLAMFET